MEETRKHLRLSSIVVLLFAGLNFTQAICALLFGDFSSIAIPEGSPENVMLIAKIVLAVIALLLMIPDIYVGVKGLRMAKNPNSSKAHIVWAIILLAITALGLIEPVMNYISKGNFYDNMTSFCSILVDVIVYFDYIKYAKEVRKQVA